MTRRANQPAPSRIRATEVAALLGLTLRGVQALAARGALPGAAKIGTLWTFDPEKLRRFVAAREAECASHESVNHGKEEYVRGDVHTNTVEGYYSVFKRGMKGVYQHCKEKHLHRYVAEFDFRYTNRSARGCEDQERATRALEGIRGKRLTYKRTGL